MKPIVKGMIRDLSKLDPNKLIVYKDLWNGMPQSDRNLIAKAAKIPSGSDEIYVAWNFISCETQIILSNTISNLIKGDL